MEEFGCSHNQICWLISWNWAKQTGKLRKKPIRMRMWRYSRTEWVKNSSNFRLWSVKNTFTVCFVVCSLWMLDVSEIFMNFIRTWTMRTVSNYSETQWTVAMTYMHFLEIMSHSKQPTVETGTKMKNKLKLIGAKWKFQQIHRNDESCDFVCDFPFLRRKIYDNRR